ncbi:hypothetical protein BKA70DRAFT_1342196 [Coprinopsis sp. MPI-PUGE-AT-0042]|nr:hypothetical protein BKA70DRAFT_1342196 [Coprinopsis sp. MPI-PUGE-AT-0042]
MLEYYTNIKPICFTAFTAFLITLLVSTRASSSWSKAIQSRASKKSSSKSRVATSSSKARVTRSASEFLDIALYEPRQFFAAIQVIDDLGDCTPKKVQIDGGKISGFHPVGGDYYTQSRGNNEGSEDCSKCELDPVD